MTVLSKKKPHIPQQSLQSKFAQARTALCRSLVERDEEVDLVLTALICQEHPLLVGMPGVAKSLLLDNLMLWFTGKKFPWLLTKFSVPEELFGPISVKGLKEDKYIRITTGKLPEADAAFLDEIFKASSAILNTLLKVLNERIYENGDGTFKKVPLRICICASNEFPQDQEGGKELGALWDRFLFRKKVRTVSLDGRRELLKRAVDHIPCQPSFANQLTPQEVDLAHEEAMQLPWGNPTKKALWDILQELNKEGICPGDRRMYKAVGAARAYAYLLGANEVLPEHLDILSHVLWDDPTEQPEKCRQVVGKIANPAGMLIKDLLIQAEDVVAKSIPTAAVPELQRIQGNLEKLGDHPKKNDAITYVGMLIKEAYHKVIGIQNKNGMHYAHEDNDGE